MTQETFPMIVGGEETLNERTLLTQVESGLMMNGADSVRFIVIHCSATQSDRDYTVEQLPVTIRYGDSVPSAIISISAGVES